MYFNYMNINGPVNYARLKGKNKEIYIFSDIHNSPENQTRCDMSNLNYDFDNYIKVFLDKNTDPLDFMLEIWDEKKSNYQTNQGYLHNVRKLFQKLKYENSKHSNVRFHYTDIRWDANLTKDDNLNFIRDKLISNNNITTFLDEYVNIANFYFELLDTIKGQYENNDFIETKLNEHKNKNLNDYCLKILNKILNKKKYHNEKNYKIIHDYFEKNILKPLQSIDSILIKLYKKSEEIEKKYLNMKKTRFINVSNFENIKYIDISYYPLEYINNNENVIKTLEGLYIPLMDLSVKIMDMYFLKRFLDKDYINKTIMYCGDFHFVHCIHLLVKYYDFEIIECDKFFEVKTLKELEEKIKKNDFEESYKYFSPDNITQCIHLKKELFT